LQKQKTAIELLNKDLTQFAHIAAHDIKSPCASIATGIDFLKHKYHGMLDDEGERFLEMLSDTSRNVIEMINGILQHSLHTNISEIDKQHFTFGSIVHEVKKLVNLPGGFTIECINEGLGLYTCHAGLLQVLLNLCNNAIKYNDKEHGVIIFSAEDAYSCYSFSVKDNGPGINPEDQSRIFDLFTTLGVCDRFNNKGTGIGLSTVRRLVQKMNGAIAVSSQVGVGSSFNFTIGK
jgi:signal transduction histidine kinase